MVVERLGIDFAQNPDSTLTGDAEQPVWLGGARLNIVASCLMGAPETPAVHYRRGGVIATMTYQDLTSAVGRVVNGYREAGFATGDRIAIAMPMTVEAVIAYLGIIAAGGVVVSIADSFAPDEIATRLALTSASAVVTQDVMLRAGRSLPMYEKVVEAGASRVIVVVTEPDTALRPSDVAWRDFLSQDDTFRPHITDSETPANILFSSGTTGTPKVIPWTHLTPIKAAMDGHFHHDIQPDDVVAWPTNLGWMMGPWLIYASLINGASLALHDDAPTGRDFGEFVQDAGVTMLGVVPSLVATWRATGCLDGLDWSAIRVLSSTGEASTPADMEWLMAVAGGKPVIEYCGGTEIGGGYITGTVLQPAVAGYFSTPALGLDVVILDDDGKESAAGELFLVPPSIGLTTQLLNRDHHEEYYAETPSPGGVTLRRHGDRMERLAGGYYQAHGRVDDTMNLGGIKVSSAEIERVVVMADGVDQVAAIAVDDPEGGPSRLVVYVVLEPGGGGEGLLEAMQNEVRTKLNPLFKITDVVVVEELPRTASAKVMRRRLRAAYPPA